MEEAWLRAALIAHQVLAQRANISYDHFIRTSTPGHRFAVQHFWVRNLIGS